MGNWLMKLLGVGLVVLENSNCDDDVGMNDGGYSGGGYIG